MKFVLFVEGPTERKAIPRFLKRWLDPKLLQAVGIQTVKYDGCSQLIADAPLKARMHIEGPKKDVIAVFALLDIYNLQLPFPSRMKSVEKRCEWARRHLEAKVGQPKFRQFFAVHEIEAWLLSEHTIFPPELHADLAGKSDRPEAVNLNEPPGKLLEKLYPLRARRRYKKPIDGEELFDKLKPEIAYRKCPNLKAMLDEMLALAKEAGL